MKQFVDRALVLRRTNYGEADRIVVMLTEQHGRQTIMAKGVRRAGSKLAAAVEPLALVQVTILPGKGDMGTLVGGRMIEAFLLPLQDYSRVQAAQECLSAVAMVAEHQADRALFTITYHTLAGLNRPGLPPRAATAWCEWQLLAHHGLAPSVTTTVNGAPLLESDSYQLDPDVGGLVAVAHGPLQADHIKLLRLVNTLTIEGIERIRVDSARWETVATALSSMRRFRLG